MHHTPYIALGISFQILHITINNTIKLITLLFMYMTYLTLETVILYYFTCKSPKNKV